MRHEFCCYVWLQRVQLLVYPRNNAAVFGFRLNARMAADSVVRRIQDDTRLENVQSYSTR